MQCEGRGGESPLHQVAAEQLLGPGEPAGNRSFGDAEPLCGRAPCQALEFAEDQSHAVMLRQPGHFLVENRPQFVESGLVYSGWLDLRPRHNLCPSFSSKLAAHCASPGVEGRTTGDAEQPVGQHLRPRDRGRLPRQYQKSSLERILRRVPVAQNPATDTQHHWPVTFDQGRERSLGRAISPRDELPQQLLVAAIASGPAAQQSVQLTQHAAQRCAPHREFSRFLVRTSYLLL